MLYYINIKSSAVKQLIALKKSFCLPYICVYCVYLLCIYKYTHIQTYISNIFTCIYMSIFIFI